MLLCLTIFSQNKEYKIIDSIIIQDPSFEIDSFKASQWIDLGFKRFTPPDLHSPDETLRRVTTKAKDGDKFISMVTRKNETYEQIGQFLSKPLKADTKYVLKISSSHFPKFKAIATNGKMMPFERPILIRIKVYDFDKNEVLTQKILRGEGWSCFSDGELIKNEEWEEQEYILEPKFDSNLIVIQCWWETPIIFPYNGHLLIDYVSNIYEIE